MIHVSYADVAAKGPKQTAEEAAAPAMPELVNTEEPSSVSASVNTISEADLGSTQPSGREGPASTSADTESFADLAESFHSHNNNNNDNNNNNNTNWSTKRRKAKQNAKKAAEGVEATPLALANLTFVVGVSAVLGFKAWGLYERGQLGWRELGIGAGILGAVGAAEVVIGQFLRSEQQKKN
ncbi:hypothetical protein jhhlp_007845 [Lomentospora prolificans]|uniref:Uncharacterized protein n=1 Tax=Lomentospora prolificans TaxID=41688 RepID=A0A2N3N0R1_9PEZI|nr:hypothetical protein jhhlp_007845 [Lomentospora prolificans]